MKKLSFIAIAFIFAFGLSFSLYSCGGNATSNEDNATEDETTTEETTTEEETVTEETTVNLEKGKEIYEGKGLCHTCHQKDGTGVESNYPPLAGADYLLADKKRAIAQTLQGSSEPITVNGTEYPGGIMGPTVQNVNLTNEEVAAVVNYILNSWGNDGGTVTVADVEEVKANL